MFYISLVATNKHGIPETNSYIFDALTEYEMRGTRVHFIDAQELARIYATLPSILRSSSIGQTTKSIFGIPTPENVYEMVEGFLKYYPNSNIIIDECPFIATHEYGKFRN